MHELVVPYNGPGSAAVPVREQTVHEHLCNVRVDKRINKAQSGRRSAGMKHLPIWSTRKVPSGCLVQVHGVLAVVESLPWRNEW